VELNLVDLKDFNLDKILCVDKEKDMFAVLGTFTSKQGQAIIVCENKKITPEEIPFILRSAQLKIDSQNTVYGFYNTTSYNPNAPHKFATTLIYPCDEKQIQKYYHKNNILFRETPEIYEKFTKPYILSHPASHIAWLNQLLEKTAEQERLLFEDPDPILGFIMYAYDKSSHVITGKLEDFKALIIVNRRDLKSLRDLDSITLPLLENIRNKTNKFVDDTFCKSDPICSHDQIRLFFHYKPTYFHLHVHVTHISYVKNEKDCRLDDVIENIKLLSDYYQKKTLIYTMETEDPLYKSYIQGQ